MNHLIPNPRKIVVGPASRRGPGGARTPLRALNAARHSGAARRILLVENNSCR
jgi:hypothetical protein